MEKILIGLNLIIDFVETYENIDEVGIANLLYKSGFEEYEIRQIMTYLDFGNFTEINGVRYFSKKEQEKLNDDAMLYIQKLLLSGAIDLMLVEEVIDRCMDMEDKVDVETIKQTLLMTLIENKKIPIFDENEENDLLN